MGQSRRWRKSAPAAEGWIAALFAALLLTSEAGAQEAPPEGLDLQLEVTLNGEPSHLIGAFHLDNANHLSATRGELKTLGLAAPGTGPPDQSIALDAVPGLTYHYDNIKQAVSIDAPASLRLATTYDASGDAKTEKAESGTGALVNYTAYAGVSHDFNHDWSAINGGSLALDAHGFSRYGTLAQSGILGTTTFSNATALRLDTTWAYDDEINLRDWRAGDIMSGGLAWTRPIRLGGGQVQRNFGLNPSLITMPMPSFSGSAAVPSTIDVFVNNVKTYSQTVQSGPYSLNNVPVMAGGGTARVVVTDPTGRQTAQDSAFYTSPDLLRKGLFDYSLDAGFARNDYGTESFNYGGDPMALASLRYGLTDWLTGEAHAEADWGLINGGLGAVTNVGTFGIVSAAGALSENGGDFGGLVFLGFDAEFGNLSLNASTRRTFGHYRDLAAVSENGNSDDWFDANNRAEDQISMSYGFPEQQASASAGFIHIEESDGDQSYIATATFTKTLGNGISLYANGFGDFGGDNYGVFAGASWFFGTNMQVSAGVDAAKDRLTATASVARSMDGSPGSYGYRVTQGLGEGSFTQASGSYHGTKALVQANAYQSDGSGNADLSVDGSVVAAGGGLFLGNRIDDAFAIVDAGASNVPVKLENRPVGVTGSNGLLLVPGLNAWEENKVSIDVTNLPLLADIPKTETEVVPRAHSGVKVGFGVTQAPSAAIVIVTDQDGKFLPPGTAVTLEGVDQSFVVGFDGEAYITGLKDTNAIDSTASNVACKGAFKFAAAKNEQQVIGPVKCM